MSPQRVSGLPPGQQFEHTGNPLLRHYLDNRANLINSALKAQSLIAIVGAVLLTQVQTFLQKPLGQYALATTLLSIPMISFFVNRRLAVFAQTGWKRKFRNLDYSGAWCYIGQFAVASKSPKLTDPARANAVAILEATFHGKFEQGEIVVDQDVFGLQIKDAFGKIQDVFVSWNSHPAFFSDRDISWAFHAIILWPTTLGLDAEFNGMERYNVIRHDEAGRPIMMTGPLTGCIQEANEFALEGKFIFWRKDAFNDLPEEARGYLGFSNQEELIAAPDSLSEPASAFQTTAIEDFGPTRKLPV